MLVQFLNNQNNDDTTGSNHEEEENPDNELPKTEKKENSAIDVNVIKGIQAQVASLTQRDELKKVGMTCPYLLE